jgi:gluconokinase
MNDTVSQLPVLVIMGVSGVGKSTVAALLAEKLGWEFAEGDVMHPTANVEKMAAGHPLDDADRWPWLEIVASWIREHTESGRPGIITCSALKRSYRDVLRGPDVVFVHLAGPTELIGSRIAERQGHFMPPVLLDSQLATLEPLGADERHLVIDAGRSPEVEAAEILAELGLAPHN